MSTPIAHEVHAFQVGHSYTNDQVRFSLSVENLGGIRPALDGQGRLQHVAVLTAAHDSGKVFSDNPYLDRIESDVLIYTAQGREGDQQLKGRNKRLIEQYAIPVPLFGFINIGRQTYRFLGLLELLRHYQEQQVDRTCGMRKVWAFEFRIHTDPALVPIAESSTLMAGILARSRPQGGQPDLVPDRDLTLGSPDREEIRAAMLRLTPSGFEHLLHEVLVRSGFTSVGVTGKTGDGGIDLEAVAGNNKHFFEGTAIQVQAKRWRHSVGNGEINQFRGAVSPRAKGVFITTSLFTAAAVKEAAHLQKPSITLYDGMKLSALIGALGIRVA